MIKRFSYFAAHDIDVGFGPAEVGPVEVGPAEDDFAEVDLAEDGPAEVNPTEAGDFLTLPSPLIPLADPVQSAPEQSDGFMAIHVVAFPSGGQSKIPAPALYFRAGISARGRAPGRPCFTGLPVRRPDERIRPVSPMGALRLIENPDRRDSLVVPH